MVEFHDATVTRIAVSVVRQQCELDLRHRTEEESGEREAQSWVCAGATSFSGSFDFPELSDHAKVGNVQDGAVNDARNRLNLSLAGGFVEATFEDIHIRQRADTDRSGPDRKPGCIATDFGKIGSDELDFSYLEAIELSFQSGECRLEMMLRNGKSYADRAPATVIFHGVAAVFGKLSIAAMTGDHKYGNVNSCTLYPDRNLIRMHLKDGFLEVSAIGISVAWR